MYFSDLTNRIYTYGNEIEDLNHMLKKAYDEVLSNKLSKYEATLILAKYHDSYFSAKQYSYADQELLSPYEFYSKTIIKTTGIASSAIIDYLSLLYTNKDHITFNKYLSLSFTNQFTITTEKLYEFTTIDTDTTVKLDIPYYIKQGYEESLNKPYIHPINVILRKIGLLESIRAYLSLPIVKEKKSE